MQFSRKSPKVHRTDRITGESLLCSEMDHMRHSDTIDFNSNSPKMLSKQAPSQRNNIRFSRLRARSNRNKAERKPQSLDYTRCYNKPYRDYIKENSQKRLFGVSYSNWVGMWSWVMVGIIGILTGIVAFLINFIVKYLSSLKFNTTINIFNQYYQQGYFIFALLVLVAFNVGFVFIAALLTAYVPLAAGSGIPEIKCYLNGIKVPFVVRLKTLIAKATGVLFSVAGGLLVGKEGPMIHSGAIIGAGVPQLRSFAAPKFLRKTRLFNWPVTIFRNDKDKRDFVSAGAAAGVAAAFGAPIGGVLFALEEGCSFWSQSLTWRALFCSMCAFFGLNLLSGLFISGNGVENLKENGYLTLIGEGLISFGTFPQGHPLWTGKDLIVFAIMGFGAGILGATFNALNERLTKYRQKYMNVRTGPFGICIPRIVETLLIAIVTSMLTFLPSVILASCIPMKYGSSNPLVANSTRYFACADQKSDKEYFNDIATLMVNPLEKAIYHLFHNENVFEMQSLIIAFVLSFFMSCWTYGSGVPSGLFVPCLLVGALYGRIFGSGVQLFYENLLYKEYNSAFFIGTYALVGAAAFLGGVVRMTISLTVIILESTNEILFGLPIMLALMIAKWTGDYFNKGLYDIHIHLNKMPLLEWDSPPEADLLTAETVMARHLTVLKEKETVGNIYSILTKMTHSGFIVVKEDVHFTTPYKKMGSASEGFNLTFAEPNTNSRTEHIATTNNYSINRPDSSATNITSPMESELAIDNNANLSILGLILRSQLYVLLYNRVYMGISEELEYSKMIEFYPKGLDLSKIIISEEEKELTLDLRPYINPSPYTTLKTTCLTQVFELFRTMGLRHLLVLDDRGKTVGIITRKDLAEDNLKRVLQLHTQGQNCTNKLS